MKAVEHMNRKEVVEELRNQFNYAGPVSRSVPELRQILAKERGEETSIQTAQQKLEEQLRADAASSFVTMTRRDLAEVFERFVDEQKLTLNTIATDLATSNNISRDISNKANAAHYATGLIDVLASLVGYLREQSDNPTEPFDATLERLDKSFEDMFQRVTVSDPLNVNIRSGDAALGYFKALQTATRLVRNATAYARESVADYKGQCKFIRS